MTQAEPGDRLQVCTICGPNDQYKEFEDVDGFIEYEAETRLFSFNMQINKDIDAGAVSAAGNILESMSTAENTDFKRMWPHLRDNLMGMKRIKEDSVPANLKHLWMHQKTEELPTK